MREKVMGGSFEILAHPADIGFAFRGDTLEDAFVQAARALLFMLGGTEALQSLRFSRTVSIVLSAPDLLDLLFDWLSEILFFFDSEYLLLGEFSFSSLSENALMAVAKGEVFDAERFETPYYVKAITFHLMELKQVEGKWNGQVFVDI